jgi:hypothetical protein
MRGGLKELGNVSQLRPVSILEDQLIWCNRANDVFLYKKSLRTLNRNLGNTKAIKVSFPVIQLARITENSSVNSFKIKNILVILTKSISEITSF